MITLVSSPVTWLELTPTRVNSAVALTIKASTGGAFTKSTRYISYFFQVLIISTVTEPMVIITPPATSKTVDSSA